jgi:hypothetical protein
MNKLVHGLFALRRNGKSVMEPVIIPITRLAAIARYTVALGEYAAAIKYVQMGKFAVIILATILT